MRHEALMCLQPARVLREKSITPLHRDPVTEASGLGILVGPNPEVDLGHLFARHSLERSEHAALAPWGSHALLSHTQIAAIIELEIGFDGISGLVSGVCCEEQLVMSILPVNSKIGVPVHATKQTTVVAFGAFNTLFDDLTAAVSPDGCEERAPLGPCGRGNEEKGCAR